MGRVEDFTSHLKRYDSSLYASNSRLVGEVFNPTGAIVVLRKNRERPQQPHIVFALTDNWTIHGKPREWGIEPVLNRLRAMDLWRDDGVVNRLEADHSKAAASEKRGLQTTIESFLLEFRRDFARSTNHINTSLLPKTDARRKGDLKCR